MLMFTLCIFFRHDHVSNLFSNHLPVYNEIFYTGMDFNLASFLTEEVLYVPCLNSINHRSAIMP